MSTEPRIARRQTRRDADVLVVGAGVVGAATAVLLATQAATRGLSVGLVEPRAPALPAPLDIRPLPAPGRSGRPAASAGPQN